MIRPLNLNNNNTQIEKSPTLAEVKLTYKNNQPIQSLPEITSPKQAEQVLREIWDTDSIQLKEEFVVLLLNNAKKLLGWSKISSGGATATIVDPASIFQVALLANATSIILVHNHPSGNLEASTADKRLTKRIRESGKMLGIEVEDHIILTTELSISFKSKGIL